MVILYEELKASEARLEELQDLLNCGDYRIDFNAIEQEIEEVEQEIENIKMELK